ncbi:hypothetical protein LTR22_027463 [Elasticomyces elasticus]|nr:hypothetical protein LTR22_027463 [Elasticomyces elasticus]
MAYDEERLLDKPLEQLLDAEWIESYQLGGFHPVDIGDTFHADRYKVVRKLGHGGPRYVAMKIISSKASSASKEIAINRSIRASNGARSHIVELLDNFNHVGPNGEHDCLVFEPMGPDVAACFERSIPYRHCGPICKQLLTALQCLHDLEVAHSDTNPGNLLLSLTHQIENLFTGGRSVSAQIHGKRNPCAPEHIYEDRPLTEFCDTWLPQNSSLLILVPATFLFNNPPERPIIAVALRAPEVVLQSTFDYRIDIWSFACYLFEVFTGQPLFTLPEFDPAGVDDDHIHQMKFDDAPFSDGDHDHKLSGDDRLLQMNNDDHLLQMISTLGLPPSAIFEKWLRRTRYFDANLKIIRTDVGQSETALGAIHVGNALEQRFQDSRPQEMTTEECADLVHVLRSALQYDPTNRPSTTELLRLDWFHRAYDVQRPGARHKKMTPRC